MTETVFFDTYAFFEVINGNANFKRFEDADVVTTIFNLVELTYGLKKKENKAVADKYLDKYKNLAVPIGIEDIKNATDMRLACKDMSFPDVIGYAVAKRLGIKFVTGDSDFEGMENVELVK
ncbi:MAG: PIN domain-containing protein [Candidatus Aenigmarchaeota archaeon]|nr:PIN domain-containing protein [Candidatus Aenigmarchaeota archaeon]